MTTYDDVLEFMQSGEVTEQQLVDMREAINEVVPPAVEETEPLEVPYWDIEGNPKAIQLGEEVIELLHQGRAQLDQIGRLRNWLQVYAKPVLKASKSGEDSQEAGIDALLALLDPEALVELGSVLILKDSKFVEEWFDISWVLDVLGRVAKYQPAIKKLTQGFFGKLG